MTGDIRLTCLSHEGSVRTLLERLIPLLSSWGIAPDDTCTAEIVLAETLNNIAEHAFPTEDGAFITLHVREVDGQLRVDVRDEGLPMPGLRLPEGAAPDPNVPRDELPEGGFGWFLIRSQTEALEYNRHMGGNHLRYAIPLSQPTQPKRDLSCGFTNDSAAQR